MIIWPEKIVFRSLCLQRLRNTIFSIMRRYSLFSQKINIYDMFLLEMRILPIGYHISYDLLSPCNQSPAYIFPTLFVLISTWQVDIRHLPLVSSSSGSSPISEIDFARQFNELIRIEKLPIKSVKRVNGCGSRGYQGIALVPELQ